MKNERQALIVIDMQNGFLEKESPLCIAGAKETVPRCVMAIDSARASGIPVIFVCRIYREDGSDVELPRKAIWEAGGKPLTQSSKGALSLEMPSEFGYEGNKLPQVNAVANKGGSLHEEYAGDYLLFKPRFSAFFHTELDLLLRRFKTDRIYLIGTTTPNCIRTTCYDGISLDYEVSVISDCCSSNTIEIQQANLADMKNAGAELLDCQEFCEKCRSKSI